MKTPELAYEKNLKALALRTVLNSPQAVELAIARYKKRIARANGDAPLQSLAFSFLKSRLLLQGREL